MIYQKIFFDLDGTITDSSQRLYKVFLDSSGASHISIDQYRQYKRSGISNENILQNELGWNADTLKTFHDHWIEKIEADEYLQFDKCFADTIPVLQELSEHSDLYVITARRFPAKVTSQLEGLEILRFFRSILVTRQMQTKAESIRAVSNYLNNSIILGDTEEETLTGKELGITTANVLTGSRNRHVLGTYTPDFIFNNLTEFANHVLSA